ncbi:MAG: restriction endonuclease subunit S [bacterium]
MTTEQQHIPKLRFPEFSGDWEGSTFKKLVKLQRGSSPRPIVKYITNLEDGVNWIKIGDIEHGKNFIRSTKEKITPEGAKKSRKVEVGDIILSNSMSYGKPIVLHIDGYIHDGWFVIRAFEKYFDKSYLLQILGSDWVQKQYKRLAAGGVVDNISSELVNSVRVNLPQLKEQQKIANFLTSIDTHIQQLTQKKALLEQYKKGMMQKLFSQEIRFKDDDGKDYPDWEEKKLGDVITCFSGGTPTSTNKEYYLGDIPFIGSGDIASDSVDLYISVDALRNSSAKLIESGDLLYALYGATSGSVAISKISGAINQAVLCIRSNQVVGFIYNLLEFKKSAIVGKYLQGGQGNLSASIVKELRFHFPSIVEQQKIADFLSALDQKIDSVANQLTQAQTYKRGLLQQMFV